MREIATDKLGPAAKELLAKAQAEGRPRGLTFQTPAADALAALQAMTDQTVSQNRRVRMPHDAECLRAGLWLLFDYFEQSHELSQNIPTPSGSYWHAILHRMEPDPANAKYWFARIGEHPILPELFNDAKEICAGDAARLQALNSRTKWDAGWFVEQCAASNAAAAPALLQIAQREWLLLFEYNFNKAFA